MVNRQEKTSSENRQNLFRWENYEDGSGRMVTAEGKSLYGYDLATGEVQSGLTGKYRFMDDDWRASCEKEYMDVVRPSEEKEAKMRKKGVYCPAYPTVSGGRGNCSEVYIQEDLRISMEAFVAAKTRADELYDEYTRWDDESKTLSDRDFCKKISMGMMEPDEHNVCCRFQIGSDSVTITADKFHKPDGTPLYDIRPEEPEAEDGLSLE